MRLPSPRRSERRSRPVGDEAVGRDHPVRGGIALGRADPQPLQAETALVGGRERVPDRQAAGLAHHAPPAGVRVRPVADLGVPAAREVEERDAADQLVGRGVRDRPADPGAGGQQLQPGREVVLGVGARVGVRQAPQPVPGALVGARLHDPLRVVGAPGPQRHLLAVHPGGHQPVGARRPLVAGAQHPDPGVEQRAALGEPLRHGALEGEPEPPGRPPRRPVAAVGPPDHRPQALLLEPPGQQQLQGPVHDPAAAGPGVGAVRDLGPGVALVAQLDGAAEARGARLVLRLDREDPAAGGPGRGHPLADEPLGHRAGVGGGHGRPGLADRVEALLEDTVDVTAVVRPQGHHAVGEHGHGLGEGGGRHRAHPAQSRFPLQTLIVVGMDESHRP